MRGKCVKYVHSFALLLRKREGSSDGVSDIAFIHQTNVSSSITADLITLPGADVRRVYVYNIRHLSADNPATLVDHDFLTRRGSN